MRTILCRRFPANKEKYREYCSSQTRAAGIKAEWNMKLAAHTGSSMRVGTGNDQGENRETSCLLWPTCCHVIRQPACSRKIGSTAHLMEIHVTPP